MSSAQGPEHDAARAPGCVLWIQDQAWEDRSRLVGVRPPMPFGEWVASLRARGWTVGWTAQGALGVGPYQGGAVVEVDAAGDRAYVAVPPELLDRLAEIMETQNYQMVHEDVAALANPQAHGLQVTRLDRAAWEERQEVVPVGEPLGTESWARVIRERRLQVALVEDGLQALDSPWPAGQVVLVSAADGTQRSYFAVPRTALTLAIDLAVETDRAPEPVSVL